MLIAKNEEFLYSPFGFVIGGKIILKRNAINISPGKGLTIFSSLS